MSISSDEQVTSPAPRRARPLSPHTPSARRIRWLLLRAGWLALLLAGLALFAACGSSPSPTPATSAFHTQLATTDNAYTLQFTATPDRLGLNTFTVQVQDAQTHQPVANLQVQLETTMLDMAMGTDVLPLTDQGKGSYGGQGSLAMSGHWQIRIVLRVGSQLHQAQVTFVAAA